MSDGIDTAGTAILAFARRYTTLLLREFKTPDGQSALDPFGTAVLLAVADHHFMVTAAHNITRSNTYLWTRREGMESYVLLHDLETHATSICNPDDPPEITTSPDEQLDNLDIAVTHIPSDLVAELGPSLQWLRLENVRWSTDSSTRSGDRYVVGYPTIHSRVDLQARQITSTLFAWKTHELPPEVRRHQWEMTLAMTPDSDDLSNTRGMSGCGVWEEHSDPESSFRLAAIQHGQTISRTAIRSTRIEVAIQIIHQDWPSLRKAIELHFPLTQEQIDRFSSTLVRV